MKLFKCPVCDEYQTYVRTAMPLSVWIRLYPDGYWKIADEDFELPYGTKFDAGDLDLSGTQCYACGHALELIEVERCPHEACEDYWDPRYRGMKRRCRLCGVEQKGRIVFDKDV